MPNRKFAGREVRDAETPLMIPLLQVDLDKAEELRSVGVNDPDRFTDCVIAQACQRMFGSSSAEVWILRTTAYVAWDGSREALRYEHSEGPGGSRKLLDAFDHGEVIEPGSQIVLNPPKPKRRLENMRAYYHNEEAHKREGQIGPRTERRQRPRSPIDLTLRNGIFARKP